MTILATVVGLYIVAASEGSDLCPVSTMKDLDEIVKQSDRVITF